MRARALFAAAGSLLALACDNGPTADFYQLDVQSQPPLAATFDSHVTSNGGGGSLPLGIAVAVKISGQSGGKPMKAAWIGCDQLVGTEPVSQGFWILWGRLAGQASCTLEGEDSNGKQIQNVRFDVNVVDMSPPSIDAGVVPVDAYVAPPDFDAGF